MKPIETTSSDERRMTTELREIWDRNAGFWDDHMGERGNDFHRELVAPAAERLLALVPGERVLEIGCGGGLFAVRMAELGAEVLATDFSAAFLARAQARTLAHAHITLRQVDATDQRELLLLGEGRFDAVVSNMALMDMQTVVPVFNAVARLLKPAGRFVFTVMHPCFNSTGVTRVVEEEEHDGHLRTSHAVKVSRYLHLGSTLGTGIRGQPVTQRYFHRPLHLLLEPAFRAGLVLDGLEEPAFHNHSLDRTRSLAAENFREIPLVLAARVRRLA